MATGNEFKITDALRIELSEIFSMQFEMIENKVQKLFIFGAGDFAEIKEYFNKVSFSENNIVYSEQNKPIMSVFAFTGKRSLKIENLLDQKGLKIIGVRVFKDCVIPLHVDLNYQSTGRDNPVYSIVVAASPDSKIYFSNRKDGTRQLAIPGLSEFIMYPTEIEHGAFSADRDMDLIQIMVDPI